jgi:hypothetical protein
MSNLSLFNTFLSSNDINQTLISKGQEKHEQRQEDGGGKDREDGGREQQVSFIFQMIAGWRLRRLDSILKNFQLPAALNVDPLDETAVNALAHIEDILKKEEKEWMEKRRTKTLEAIGASLQMVNLMKRVLRHEKPRERFMVLALHIKGRKLSNIMASIRVKKGAGIEERKQAERKRFALQYNLRVLVRELHSTWIEHERIDPSRLNYDDPPSLEDMAKDIDDFDPSKDVLADE